MASNVSAILLPVLTAALSIASSTQANGLSYEEELSCLGAMYVYRRNIFNEQNTKRHPSGFAMTPSEAVTPFEPGDYLPKLDRIRKAANEGNFYANTSLGKMYLKGVCVASDFNTGMEYLEKAGAYGLIVQWWMEIGVEKWGPQRAKLEAYKWYRVASLRHPFIDEGNARTTLIQRGNKNPTDLEVGQFVDKLQPSKEKIGTALSRMVIELRFTKEEVAEAERMAHEWVRQHP